MSWAAKYLIKQSMESSERGILAFMAGGGPGGFASQYHSSEDDPRPVRTALKGILMGHLLGAAGGAAAGVATGSLPIALAVLLGGHYAGGYLMRRTPEESAALKKEMKR